LILNIYLFVYLFICLIQKFYTSSWITGKSYLGAPILSTGEALPSFELEVTLTFTHFPDARFSDFLIDDNY